MRILILAVLLLSLQACGGEPYSRMLAEAARMMEHHPDSALHTLRALDARMLGSPRLRAEYALLYSQALDKLYVDVQSDTLIRPAVEYYERRGDARHRAASWFYLGRVYDNAGRSQEAVEAYLTAREWAVRCDDAFLAGLASSNLGRQAQRQSDFQAAARHYEQSLDCFVRQERLHHAMLVHAALSKVFLLSGDGERALLQAEHAARQAAAQGDTSAMLRYNALVASIGLHQLRNPDMAQRRLREGYRRYSGGTPPLVDYPLLALLALEQGRSDSARSYLLEYLSGAADATLRQRAGAEALLVRAERMAGNDAAAWEHNERYRVLMDSISVQERRASVAAAERRWRSRLLEHENENLRLRSRLQLLLAGSAGVLLALAIWRLAARYRRALRRKNMEVARHRFMVRRLKEDYAKLLTVSDELSRRLDERGGGSDRLRAAAERKINALKSLLELADRCGSHDKGAFYDKFREYVTRDGGNFALLLLRDLVNERYYGLIDHLRDRYPDLTEADLDLCCLLCLGVSASTIYLTLNITQGYYYNRRMRLRKKIGLYLEGVSAENRLNDIIAELAAEAGNVAKI